MLAPLFEVVINLMKKQEAYDIKLRKKGKQTQIVLSAAYDHLLKLLPNQKDDMDIENVQTGPS